MQNDPYENSATRASLINRIIGERYEVLESLGDGLILSAYRARDRQMNRIVTLRTLRPDYNTPDLIDALKIGLGQTLALNHASIARIFDVGMDPATGLLYVAEEYVRGIDLKERIRRTAPFQLAAATDTAIAIAEALEVAHARGIAHGDVRPQNVLIGPENQIKLSGFGVAVAQTRAAINEPTLLQKIVGYIAPDTARAASPTPSADLYGLGCVLFEMLTGDVPYSGDSPLQVAVKHAQDPIPSPRQINGGVPPALDGIIRKALGKTPETRYSSATEFLRDLRAVRDALRFGKPLAWTPQERENSGVRTVPTPTTGVPADALNLLPARPPAIAETATVVAPLPNVMPTKPAPPAPPATAPTTGTATVTARIVRTDELPDAAQLEEERRVRSRGPSPVHWLTLVNLLIILLIIGGAGWLYQMVMVGNRPDTTVVVPSLIDKTLTDAEDIAAKNNFKISVVARSFREKEPKEVIYQQGIAPGRTIVQGKTVPIWVSDGPRMALVPDVRDMSFDKARRILERNGLRVGDYRSDFDPLAPKGNVISQTPPPGENRPRGTPVNLVISKGEQPLPTPEPYPTEEATPIPDFPAGDPTPDGEPSPDPIAEPRVRYFRIVYPERPIPEGEEPHRIRIDVIDNEGPHTVFDESRAAGEQVRIERVKTIGDNITIKIYDNDQLMAEINKP